MEVDFAFLADKAEAINGKLYTIGGGVDTIWATKTPAVHPMISFALRLMFSPAELGRKHALEINLMDEDGKRSFTLGAQLDLRKRNPSLPKGFKQGVLTCLNFPNLSFSNFGHYSFEVVINNTSLKSVPLRIAKRIASLDSPS